MAISKDNIKAVILVDGVDLGRCPIGSRVPRALWPVGEKTVLENLIEQLAGQGIRRVAVCQTDGRGEGENRPLAVSDWLLAGKGRKRSVGVEKGRRGEELLIHKDGQEGSRGEGIVIQYIAEEMPRGAGGCLFDAGRDGDELLLVLNCNIISVPNIAEILDSHTAAKADMTIGFNPSRGGDSLAVDASQVFLCERSVLEHITDVGYCDIKEGLIRQLVAVGKKIHAFSLSDDLGAFRSWREYLAAVELFLQKVCDGETILSGYKTNGSKNVRLGADGVAKAGPPNAVIESDWAHIGILARFVGSQQLDSRRFQLTLGEGRSHAHNLDRVIQAAHVIAQAKHV